jgi:hypothetical protein
VKKFAPHIDHFMHNETAQIVDYLKVVSRGAGHGVAPGESAIIESMVKLINQVLVTVKKTMYTYASFPNKE